MSRGRRIGMTVGLLALGGLLIAGGAYWFDRNYQRVEKTLYLPPGGEAAYNPLYALRQTLRADGVKAETHPRLALGSLDLRPQDTLLLFNDSRVLTPAQSTRLLAWVAEGGHLLLRTPAPSRWDGESTVPLLDTLRVHPTRQSSCERMQEIGDRHVEFCRGRRFRMRDVEPELAWGDLRNGYVHARIAHGKGHVDVLADFDFLINTAYRGTPLGSPDSPPTGGLRDVPHQALARQVLAPNYRQGTMHLIYAAQMPSLRRTILFEGWMVWAPLLAALLAWLWSRMSPFGPPLPAPAMERRSLLEHVRASGDHLFRYGRGVLLYVAVRQAFLARLRRRDPVAAALSDRAQAEAIAARTGIAADIVQRALQTPASRDRAAFRDRISLLIQLRNRL